MSNRPLIPALSALVTGILTGNLLYNFIFPLYPLLFILTMFLLIASFLKMFSANRYILPAVFMLTGMQLSVSSYNHSDLLLLAEDRKKAVIEGTVLSPSKSNGKSSKLEIMTEYVFINDQIENIREKLPVTVYNNVSLFYPGDRIRFPAKLKPVRNFNNPGRYNYESAMRLTNVYCTASVSDGRMVVPMGKGSLGFPAGILESIRGPIRTLFTETLQRRNLGLYCALILGERQGIDSELREPFLTTGLGHVLAVSGLHIGLIAWLTFALTQYLLSLSYSLTLKTDIQRLSAAITCIPVILYTFLAGFQVSGQRAMIMALTYLFSIIFRREKETWSTLALAALIVLALDPNALFSVSFQLSFLAVTGILWLAPVIYELFPSQADPAKKQLIHYRFYTYMAGMTVITVSVTLFLLPVTSFYFHRISIISVIANLTVIPVLGIWIIPVGLLSAVTVHIFPPLAAVLILAGSAGLDLIMNIIQFWAGFRWADTLVVTPNLFEIILYYSLILSIYLIKVWRPAKICLILVIIIMSGDIAYWTYQTQFNPRLKVTYLDVGQGNSALIQFPGRRRMIIDGGGFSGDTFDTGALVVAPFLLSNKIRRVDYLVLSHPQSDHMNGLRYIAENFSPGEFWFNGDTVETPSFIELTEIIKSKNIKTVLPHDITDGRIISGVAVRLLHPIINGNEPRVAGSKELNNNSLVLRLTHNGKSFLFPGDLEMQGEKKLVSTAGYDLKSDILLAPHHGSRYSCSRVFLEAVNPALCIISSGANNFFGFPHKETIQKLEETGCSILRTDQLGAIQISFINDRVNIKTYIKSF